MVMVPLLQQKRSSSYSWWFDSHKNTRQSPWLLSTLSELEEKTTRMLKLIEEDADSFAQRAEMYYKKRPELVNMVEDFYRAHRSLAEQFDQLKSDNRTRHTTPLGSPTKSCWLQNLSNPFDRFTVTPEPSESEESEVDDPEDDGEIDSSGKEEILKNVGDDSDVDGSDKGMILKNRDKQQLQQEIRLKQMAEELERLKEENRVLKAQLEEKDEQKREVIRQLSLSMSILKGENVELKKRCVVGASQKGSFDIKKLVFGAWSGRWFSELQLESRTTLVAL